MFAKYIYYYNTKYIDIYINKMILKLSLLSLSQILILLFTIIIFVSCHTITTINTKTTTTTRIQKISATPPPYNPKYISEKNSSVLWKNPPQSQAYINNPPKWYDLINTWSDKFVSGDYIINVNMDDLHGAIHLYADPDFLQSYDDKLRKFNGVEKARDSAGTIDRCGWPNLTATETDPKLQYYRSTTPFVEDFSDGLKSTSFYVAKVKGCCDEDKYNKTNKFGKNINVIKDVVNGVEKNVLALTAWSEDNPSLCPGPRCRKDVTSNGAVVSANIYGSGRYEVIANVANASGLVWAIWTFHYEEHLPNDCSKYVCWCENMPSREVEVADKCEFRADGTFRPCKYKDLCDNNTDGWNPIPPPAPPLMTPKQCGEQHVESDPQFLGNNTFGGWETTVNHEIDIEIPANCAATPNVCNRDVPGVPGAKSCTGDYSTSNINNYIYSQNSGTGPSYSNGCVKVTSAKDGKPFQLIGDGQYHNYTIVWHTGEKEKPGWTEFYVDDIYLGTNNAFVPTRGSRFFIAHWYPSGQKNAIWNGRPNDWDGGVPGDGQTYSKTTKISEVRITPFDEPNDIMAVNTADMPTGCNPSYQQKYDGVCHPHWEAVDIKPSV